jgi:hypothetical protein
MSRTADFFELTAILTQPWLEPVAFVGIQWLILAATASYLIGTRGELTGCITCVLMRRHIQIIHLSLEQVRWAPCCYSDGLAAERLTPDPGNFAPAVQE